MVQMQYWTLISWHGRNFEITATGTSFAGESDKVDND
jgi:hypothetical protein